MACGHRHMQNLLTACQDSALYDMNNSSVLGHIHNGDARLLEADL